MKKSKKIVALTLSVVMAMGLMSGIQSQKVDGAAVTTRYEAEDGDTSNAQKIHTGVTNASGSKGVVCRPTQYVSITVDVNTDSVVSCDFETTGASSNKYNGWNTFKTKEVELNLSEGKNVITLKNVGEGDSTSSSKFITFDYIEITEKDDTVTYPEAIGRHEAEEAQDLNGNVVTTGDYYSNCSNKGIVGVGWFWIANDKKYITWTVDADEAGEYKITLSYCAPKVSEFLIKTNNDEWTPFYDEMNWLGKVAPATGAWNTTAQISTVVSLKEGTNTISVSGPVLDNTGNGNFFTIYGNSSSNISSANLDCIDIEKYEGSTVTVDNENAKITDGKVSLGNAQYGYLCDGKMYSPNSSVYVTGDMAFTSVNTLNVSMTDGAGIRYIGDPGLRFRTTITSDNSSVLDSKSVTEGTLITAKDIYEKNGSELDLTKEYQMINVVNSGWFGNTGIYCGAICKIQKSNYTRDFIARAYATIKYEDGTSTIVYSTETPARAIKTVAELVKKNNYVGIDSQYYSVIDSFIQ